MQLKFIDAVGKAETLNTMFVPFVLMRLDMGLNQYPLPDKSDVKLGGEIVCPK